jgi:hypothetical protein
MFLLFLRQTNRARRRRKPMAVYSFILRRPLLRADSGYCNNAVFQACEQNDFGFLIAMRENLYNPLLRRRIKWRSAKDPVLEDEQAEIGESLYYSKLCEKVFE